MKLSRRSVSASLSRGARGACVRRLGCRLAAAQGTPERKWRHGLSLFGEPRYPAGFKHFDYVNPAAPQGRRRARDCLRHIR